MKHEGIQSYENYHNFTADVTNYEELEQVLQRCEIEVGPIDMLVNSAGYSYPSKLEDVPLHHIKVLLKRWLNRVASWNVFQ